MLIYPTFHAMRTKQQHILPSHAPTAMTLDAKRWPNPILETRKLFGCPYNLENSVHFITEPFLTDDKKEKKNFNANTMSYSFVIGRRKKSPNT